MIIFKLHVYKIPTQYLFPIQIGSVVITITVWGLHVEDAGSSG